jgi:DNA-binding NarL/FixJ family response regulator
VVVRVLVIDPSAEVRRRLVARLIEAGLEVIAEGDTAAAAMALTLELAPDAVVLDVMLPDRHGLDLVPALRAIRASLRIAVVSNADAYRRRCLALGADVFLDKSAEFDLVAGALRGRAQ